MKGQKGITLIALVITIIVMLILVGVTVTLAIQGNLFDQANTATTDYNNQAEGERNLSNGKVTIVNTETDQEEEWNVSDFKPSTAAL